MGRKSKLSEELKIKVCEEYLNGEKSGIQIANDLSINESIFYRWLNNYRIKGRYAFVEKPRNASYSISFKLRVIKDYLESNVSVATIALKYNISNSMVFNWVKMYNKGIEIKEYDPKGDVYTMKARHTTFEERLEIVQFVISNNNSYKLAADKYLLPYSLIYQWTKKYLTYGEEHLKYKKKGPKPIDYIEDNLTDIERLTKEIQFLKKQNEYLKLSNEVLKKKEELERKAEFQRLGKKKRT